MFGSDDSRLHEEDFIFVPEFRSYLEGYHKASGSGLARKTINRHVVNIMDFLYYSSTHNRNVDPDGPDEIPVDVAMLKRGKKYFSPYFVGWLCYTNGNRKRQLVSRFPVLRGFTNF